jgi:hypothetical protein
MLPGLLQKMAEVASARLVMANHIDKIEGWERWLKVLSRKGSLFTSSNGHGFRRLLHVLEGAYIQNLLVGSQAEMRRYLHGSMITVHKNLVNCEHPGCGWVSHECFYRWRNQENKCLLLPKHNEEPEQFARRQLTRDSRTHPSNPSSRSSISSNPRLWLTEKLRRLTHSTPPSVDEDVEKKAGVS